jgi:anti-sigma regulatory factor (Ser/Thr protein kinase)
MISERSQQAALPAGVIVALPRSLQVGIEARDAVRCFADQLGAQRTANACLLVSELVTNAYRHGEGQIRLTITLDEHVARFAVSDEGDRALLRTAHPDERGGWGLNMVAQIADRWGTHGGPTAVWFELFEQTGTTLI